MQGPADSIELRVLAALAAGASLPAEIAAGLLQPPETVQSALDWAVDAELVARTDSPAGATFSLTPRGRELLAAPLDPQLPPAHHRAAPQPTAHGPSTPPSIPDAGSCSGTSAEESTGQSTDNSTDKSTPDVKPPTRKPVTWRHVVYAAAYVVLGLFLLTLQPAVGSILVVAGLALGAYTLRPLFADRS